MSLLRIATYPHILLQCVGAMVPEWLWRRGIFIPFFVFLSILSSALRHTFYCLLECGKRLYMIRQERLERSTYCFHIINSISLNKTPDDGNNLDHSQLVEGPMACGQSPGERI